MKQRWTDGYILIMLGVFPLWLGWSGYSSLTAQKYAFFMVVTGIWLLGLLWNREPWPIPKTGGSRWVCFLMAGLCVSALLSPFGLDCLIGVSRYDGLLTWLLYGGIFLGVSACGRPRLAHAYALAFSGTVNCVIAVVQLLGYNCLWLFPNARTFYDSGVYYTGEFLGLIGNTDLLAAFFCLVIPVCFGVFVLYGGRKTAGLLPAGALCLFVLLEAGVSGGLVGLAVCVLVGAPLILTDRERLSRGLYVLAVSAASAGLSFAVCFSSDSVKFKLCKLALALLCTAIVLGFLGYFIGKKILNYVNHNEPYSSWNFSAWLRYCASSMPRLPRREHSMSYPGCSMVRYRIRLAPAGWRFGGKCGALSASAHCWAAGRERWNCAPIWNFPAWWKKTASASGCIWTTPTTNI